MKEQTRSQAEHRGIRAVHGRPDHRGGITHEIRVGRDKSWVRYEAVTKIRPGEESDDARTRAIGHVNESVMEAVAQVVETVRNHR
jgi:hypothetical protein